MCGMKNLNAIAKNKSCTFRGIENKKIIYEG